jgi:catechol 2,3-dioxygenase-like lactoylglutathione lyase family enzyme
MSTKPTLQVIEMAFTGYPVTDMARARAFYEGILNLKTSMVYEHETRAWVEYDIGAGTLAVTNMSVEKWKPSVDGPAVALEVADFDAAVAVLRAGGVRFSLEPMDSGVCHLAVVHDPDGNAIAIHKRKPQQG